MCCASTSAGVRARNAVEQSFGPRFLFGFDFVPAALHVVGGLGVAFGENVRMAADQFRIDGVKRIGDVEAAFFSGHLREEHGLKQQIAQFFGEVRRSRARRWRPSLRRFLPADTA